jgi:choline dehydrogenase
MNLCGRTQVNGDQYKYCKEREAGVQNEDFAERVRVNQTKLTFELKPHYDFIIYGSGSSGSTCLRR